MFDLASTSHSSGRPEVASPPCSVCSWASRRRSRRHPASTEWISRASTRAPSRRQIGVVLQSGTLLAGSIWENICGATVHRMEDVWEAARMAGVDEDIRRMPMGMHTIVQAGGGGLSGGQRQRILIARALVGKPRLLLFDEATSALDNRTQAIVSESLKTLHATRIVIAHRLSTILGADRIFVLDQGRIVQSGHTES